MPFAMPLARGLIDVWVCLTPQSHMRCSLQLYLMKVLSTLTFNGYNKEPNYRQGIVSYSFLLLSPSSTLISLPT